MLLNKGCWGKKCVNFIDIFQYVVVLCSFDFLMGVSAFLAQVIVTLFTIKNTRNVNFFIFTRSTDMIFFGNVRLLGKRVLNFNDRMISCDPIFLVCFVTCITKKIWTF